jgi:hypothetical protein
MNLNIQLNQISNYKTTKHEFFFKKKTTNELGQIS